jgi:hypothetical protein
MVVRARLVRPGLPDLHAGQIVEVRQEDIFDYILQYPGNHSEGNSTGKMIEAMEETEKSKRRLHRTPIVRHKMRS